MATRKKIDDSVDLLTKELFLAHMEPLTVKVAELAEAQKTANGRTGKLETRVSVLEDRSPGRAGVIAGSVGASVVAGLLELGKWLAHR